MRRVKLKKDKTILVYADAHTIKMVYGLTARVGDIVAHEVANDSHRRIGYVVDDSDPATVTLDNFHCRYRIGRATIQHIWRGLDEHEKAAIEQTVSANNRVRTTDAGFRSKQIRGSGKRVKGISRVVNGRRKTSRNE